MRGLQQQSDHHRRSPVAILLSHHQRHQAPIQYGAIGAHPHAARSALGGVLMMGDACDDTSVTVTILDVDVR
jgi:hypothetical protein